MKKKFLRITLVVLAFVLVTSTVFAADAIRVQKNGKFVNFEDESGNKVDPQIVNDRTMVPMRKIFEEFGMEIEWTAETRTVVAKNDEKTISLTIGSKEATVGKNASENDEVARINLDAEPVIVDGRTMVPVRFIAESLEKQVGWDAENRCVIIIDFDEFNNKLKESSPAFYELSNTEETIITSLDSETTLDAKVTYTDKDDKANNGTIVISGDVDLLNNEEAMQMAMELELKGTGSFKDVLNSSKLTYDIVADIEGATLYAKTSLTDETLDGKWAKTVMPAEIIEMVKMSKTNSAAAVNELLNSKDVKMDINTYAELEAVMDLISELTSSKYFKVSGSSSKTYTWKLTLEDIFTIINTKYSAQPLENSDITELLKIMNLEVTIKMTVKNGVATKTVIELDGEYTDTTTNEKIAITGEITSKINSYNKNVSISIPKDSQTVDVDNY